MTDACTRHPAGDGRRRPRRRPRPRTASSSSTCCAAGPSWASWRSTPWPSPGRSSWRCRPRSSCPWMAEPANRLAHWVVQVFFQDKFRTLFSMLFGVSIFLVGGERSDLARGKLLRAAPVLAGGVRPDPRPGPVVRRHPAALRLDRRLHDAVPVLEAREADPRRRPDRRLLLPGPGRFRPVDGLSAARGHGPDAGAASPRSRPPTSRPRSTPIARVCPGALDRQCDALDGPAGLQHRPSGLGHPGPDDDRPGLSRRAS